MTDIVPVYGSAVLIGSFMTKTTASTGPLAS